MASSPFCCLMDDRRAQELREAFNRLADEHVIRLTEVELIPAVLGRAAPWEYITRDGAMISAGAYDQASSPQAISENYSANTL